MFPLLNRGVAHRMPARSRPAADTAESMPRSNMRKPALNAPVFSEIRRRDTKDRRYALQGCPAGFAGPVMPARCTQSRKTGVPLWPAACCPVLGFSERVLSRGRHRGFCPPVAGQAECTPDCDRRAAPGHGLRLAARSDHAGIRRQGGAAERPRTHRGAAAGHQQPPGQYTHRAARHRVSAAGRCGRSRLIPGAGCAAARHQRHATAVRNVLV